LYVGCTRDLKNKLTLHNAKMVESTKKRVPYKLIHYEVFINKDDAFARELWLKIGWGRNHLKKILINYLKV